MPQNMISLVLAIASEIIVGAAIGLVIKFIFTGIEFAGQFASFEMGLSMASCLRPGQRLSGDGSGASHVDTYCS